jgi:hypothetical protein
LPGLSSRRRRLRPAWQDFPEHRPAAPPGSRHICLMSRLMQSNRTPISASAEALLSTADVSTWTEAPIGRPAAAWSVPVENDDRYCALRSESLRYAASCARAFTKPSQCWRRTRLRPRHECEKRFRCRGSSHCLCSWCMKADGRSSRGFGASCGVYAPCHRTRTDYICTLYCITVTGDTSRTSDTWSSQWYASLPTTLMLSYSQPPLRTNAPQCSSQNFSVQSFS